MKKRVCESSKLSQIELLDDALLEPSLLDNLNNIPEETKIWPCILLEMHDVLQHTLKKHGIDIPELALDCVLDISEHIGGIQVYLPRGERLRLQIRDMKMWNEFNGHNIHVLAKRYKVTYNTIYNVCAKMRKIEQAKRQPDLFG